LHEGIQAFAGAAFRHLWTEHVPVKLWPTCTFSKEGYCFHGIQFDGEAGTHLVTPANDIPGAPNVEETPLEHLVHEAVVLRIPKKSDERVEQNEVEEALKRVQHREGEIVLLHTGWGDLPEIRAKWYDRKFVMDSPFMSGEAAALMSENKVPTFGSDMAAPDKWTSTDWPAWRAMTKKYVKVISALNGLNQLHKDRVLFIALPLKTEMHSSPIRAIAIEE
jgi:kynurenine formamidase